MISIEDVEAGEEDEVVDGVDHCKDSPNDHRDREDPPRLDKDEEYSLSESHSEIFQVILYGLEDPGRVERSENLHHEDDECETLEILEQHFGGFWWFLVVFGGFGGFNFNIYQLIGESNFVL